jgi:Uma2 family endonuclease
MIAIKEETPFNIDEIQVEDGKPVDNYLSEKQMRLLTEPLYTSWKSETHSRFLVASNVGIFTKILRGGIAPDVLLSMDVEKPKSSPKNEDKCYYLDKLGKAPEVVIEIVSNREGDELGGKLEIYGKIGVKYYAVYDPYRYILKKQSLVCYEYKDGLPVIMQGDLWFPEANLGLCLWNGFFENEYRGWLRWCYSQGSVIPTGKEVSVSEKLRADREEIKAEMETERADIEHAKRKRSEENAEIAKAEAERAKAEAEQAKAEAERAKAEKDLSIQKAILRGKLTLEEIAEDFGVSLDDVKRSSMFLE